MDFLTCLTTKQLILTECAIAERLRRDPEVRLHPSLFNTPLVYEEQGRRKMQDIYGQYRSIARKAGLPVLLCAPTWRVDRDRLQEAGMNLGLNRDAARFMQDLQLHWQSASSPVYIGGLIGPKNDCYRPQEALAAAEAAAFHRWQAEELAAAGVQVIIAQTIPAVSEALGLAEALGDTGVPYIISFVINRKTEVLDGTELTEAITTIDSAAARPPAGYMVNCAYPAFLHPDRQPPELFQRLIGIQANGSSRDHDQLDGAAELQQDSLEEWGELMLQLNRHYGVRILGGCCGTDDSYLRYLVSH